MLKPLPLLAAAALALGGTLPQVEPAPAATVAGSVHVVRFEGPLSEWWSALLERAGDEAIAAGASALLVELDTPGGEVELMKRLGDRLVEIGDQVPTVCFITHRAWSAGAFLAMGCDEIWMTPGSSIGASMPIAMLPGGIVPEVDEDLQEKQLSAFRAEFRSWAQSRGREPNVAEAFVDNGIELRWISLSGERRLVNGTEYAQLLEDGELPSTLKMVCESGELLALTPDEAAEVGYCEGQAEDRDHLFELLGWSGRGVVDAKPSWSESLVGFIGGYSWLLLLGAAFFMVVSFNMPGMGAPEAAALFCIVVFLFHGYLVGLAEWTEMLLVLGGLVLLAVELFVLPGMIIPGALGALLVGAGLLMAMQDFVVPQDAIDAGVFQQNLLVLLALAVFTPFLSMMAVRKLSQTRAGAFLSVEPTADFSGPVSGVDLETAGVALASIASGAIGIAITALRPAGRIEIDGEPFDAISDGGFLERGAAVRVLKRQGGSLLVTAAPHAGESG